MHCTGLASYSLWGSVPLGWGNTSHRSWVSNSIGVRTLQGATHQEAVRSNTVSARFLTQATLHIALILIPFGGCCGSRGSWHLAKPTLYKEHLNVGSQYSFVRLTTSIGKPI